MRFQYFTCNIRIPPSGDYKVHMSHKNASNIMLNIVVNYCYIDFKKYSRAKFFCNDSNNIDFVMHYGSKFDRIRETFRTN